MIAEENRNNSILISVIVPVYNVAPYVEACVNSILQQTHKCLEVILVDDGSADESGQICESFTDSRIIVIHQQNQGLSAARNTGIEQARGEYLLFVDSDDCIEPTMAEKLLEACIAHGTLMSMCNYRRIEEDGRIGDKCAQYEPVVETGCGMLAKIAPPGHFVVAWNKLYHRSLFAELRYPVGKLHEDLFVIGDVCLACPKVVTIEDVLYSYRIRGGSVVNSKKNIRRLDEVEGYLLLGEKFLGKPELCNNAWKPVKQGLYIYALFCKEWHYSEELRRRTKELQDLYAKQYKRWVQNAPFSTRVICFLFRMNFYWGAKIFCGGIWCKDRLKGIASSLRM